jgi:GntR family transcriptional regulator
MALDSPGTGAPLFRRVADALADAIGRGDYPVGTRLPPEFTLGRMFGASRFTIREALVELRTSGLVASRRGSGTVVLRRAPQAFVFSESYQSIDAFLASVVEVPLQPLEIKDVIADDSLAAALRCEPGRQFLLLRGVRRPHDRPDEPPMALTDAYINATYSAIRPRLAMLSESIAGTAEKFLGVRVRSITQELEPVVLDAEQAARLSAPMGGPAMLVRRWYFLDDAVALLISRSVYPHGRLLFRTDLRRSPAPLEEARP